MLYRLRKIDKMKPRNNQTHDEPPFHPKLAPNN